MNLEYVQVTAPTISYTTADQINAWLKKNAPSNSILQGHGDDFIYASKVSGLSPAYLAAHAALETGWGTSNIAKDKNNFYGIGAFDSSPYKSAYGFDGIRAGIVEGAKWIAENYTAKGQDTLYKMRFNNGSHQYATDPNWSEKIANIMKGLLGFGDAGGGSSSPQFKSPHDISDSGSTAVYNSGGEGLVEDWKKKLFEDAKAKGLISSDEWITKLNDKAPVWMVLAVALRAKT